MSRNRWCWAPLVAEASLCLAAPPARADSDAYRPEVHLTNTAPPESSHPVAVLALTVTLNGQDRGIAELRESQGRLWIAKSVLRTLGVVPPPGGPELLPLDTIPGALVDYHASDLALDLTVPVTQLDAPTTRLNFGELANPRAQHAVGAVLNYDTQTDFDDTGVTLHALIDFRAFAGNINVESTQAIDVATNRIVQPHAVQAMRFDTTLSVSIPGSRLSLRLGDTVTSSVDWSRATRLGGVQIGTDFALQPYFITAPIPAFYGSAVLPSTADVYVDGMRRFSGSVPPGPYQIGIGPARIDGAGAAQLVLTNSLGQVSSISMPIYETPMVLRAGLDDWSAEAGFVRRDYGYSSFSYWEAPAASASWRHGLTDRMTISAHVEATRGAAQFGLANVGAGTTVVMGQAGVVSASYAQSWSNRGSGKLLALGYTLTAYQLHVAASVQRTFGPYADLASIQGGPQVGPSAEILDNSVPRESDIFQIGWSSHHYGNIGANVVRRVVLGQTTASYGGAFWSMPLSRRLAVYVSANQNLARRGDHNAFFTLSFTPNARLHGSVDASAEPSGSAVAVSMQAPPDPAGGLGWKAGALAGSGAANHGGSALAEIEWLGSGGDARLGAAHGNGVNSAYVADSGSIALMAGGVFFGRRINNSFAVVSTDGLAHVPVTFQNRPIGTTDGHGRLLVADLNAYQHNTVGIDPTDLPDGYQVDRLDLDAVPAGHAGVAVHFAIRQFSGVTMTLVRPSGEPVAAGTPTNVAGMGGSGGTPLTVGFDGQLYIENPPPGARVVAGTPDLPCHFMLPAAIPRGDIVPLGRVMCEAGP